MKYYFDELGEAAIQSHFNKGLVQMKCKDVCDASMDKEEKKELMRKILATDKGAVVYVSVLESRISRRFDVIPSGTLYPNADEIAYSHRLVHYKDYALLALNKPPKLPVKGHLPLHNSMDALVAAALSYDNEEGP